MSILDVGEGRLPFLHAYRAHFMSFFVRSEAIGLNFTKRIRHVLNRAEMAHIATYGHIGLKRLCRSFSLAYLLACLGS